MEEGQHPMDLGAGELYFVREIDPQTKKYTKFVKIGLVHEKEGRDSLNRLSEHQTGNPRTLYLPPENYFLSPAINRVEAMMHKVFARNRVSGEWFEFETERQVSAAIKKAKELAAEVAEQIPTFTKAAKLGQSQDNGKTISATSNVKKLIKIVSVARAKRDSLLAISDLISSNLKSAITDGLNVEGVATEVSVNRKGKFKVDLLKTDDPKTYKKYLVTTQMLSARFIPKLTKLNLQDLDRSFQSLVEQLNSRVKNAKKGDFRVLNEVQLILTDEIAGAEWDEEFAVAELKLACGRNEAIEGVCTWTRKLVERDSFDEKSFKLNNPSKYERYLEKPKTTTYLKIAKRKV
jgi:ribosomal protein L17